MIDSKDIDALMGADVVDDEDDRIGKVSQVYVDSHDQHPSWIAVKTGFFGSAETLVPIEDASWDSARVHVGVSKDKVKDAPHVDPDREITVDEQNRLYRHYGIAASVQDEGAGGAAAGAADDAGEGADQSHGRHVVGSDAASDRDAVDRDGADRGYEGAASQDADEVTRDAETGTVVSDNGSYSVEDATPTADATPDAAAGRDVDRDADEDRDTAAARGGADDAAPGAYSQAEQVAEDGTAAAAAPAHRDDRGAPEAAAPAGAAAGSGYRMRLRKVTVTEQRTVTVTVPVAHEEVRLERVPDDEPDGPDVIRDQADVVLMEERPVVSTEQVATERVHVAIDAIEDGERSSAV